MAIESSNPDLVALADDVATAADSDAADALSRWNEAVDGLSPDLRQALGWLVESRLTWKGQAALRSDPHGQTLAFEWAAERNQRPSMPRLPFFSPRAAYAYCASLVVSRGGAKARDALRNGRPLLLGLRKDTSTLANKGRGVYDDWIAVLNGRGGLHAARFFPACTEPGAQYSPRSAPAAKGGKVDARYAEVKFRKADGFDADKDGIQDLGRLREGTYVFRERSAFLGDRAFQSTTNETAERDTDGDGWFTRADPSRIDTKGAGRSMLIHRGGASTDKQVNTWSAGCQTIPQNFYHDFLRTLGRPASFCYVLVNTR